MNTTNATLLEKMALDTGFDRELPREGDWQRFASSHTAMMLGLTALGGQLFLASFSQQKVLKALTDVGTLFTNPLPTGMVGARAVTSLDALHQLVKRAFSLSRTLPDELLHQFEAAASALPRATEAERLVVQRVGQDVFRKGLLEYWDGRCAITGLAVPELLRASHIKPWADCATDAERLDVFNGLLLAPHLDAAFDLGFITVEDDGALSVWDALGTEPRRLLGLSSPVRVHGLTPQHRTYLPWHREKLFGKLKLSHPKGIP